MWLIPPWEERAIPNLAVPHFQATLSSASQLHHTYKSSHIYKYIYIYSEILKDTHIWESLTTTDPIKASRQHSINYREKYVLLLTNTPYVTKYLYIFTKQETQSKTPKYKISLRCVLQTLIHMQIIMCLHSTKLQTHAFKIHSNITFMLMAMLLGTEIHFFIIKMLEMR